MRGPTQELKMTNQERVDSFLKLLELETNVFNGDKKSLLDFNGKHFIAEMTEAGFSLSSIVHGESTSARIVSNSCHTLFVYGPEGEFLRSHSHFHDVLRNQKTGDLIVTTPGFDHGEIEPPESDGDKMIKELVRGLESGEASRAPTDPK